MNENPWRLSPDPEFYPPNPWIDVAPPCPRCRQIEPVMRYAPGGSLWRCIGCSIDFRAKAVAS